jgi:hypothetical protein
MDWVVITRDFDRRLMVEFRGSLVTSAAGLPADIGELDSSN